MNTGECKNDKENAYILQFPPFGPASDAALYRVKIRNTVLQSLINAIMLNVGHVSVFLSALSPQWVLNFCGPHLDPVTVAFSLHLFVRLWSKGENVAYDSNNSQRFVIIAHALREYHDITPIYFAVLSLLFGKDKIPAGISFDFPSLLAVFKPNGGSKSAMVPDAFQVVLALIRSSTDFILKEHQNLERPESDSIRYVSGITWDVGKTHWCSVLIELILLTPIDTKPDIMYFEDSTYLWTAAQNNQALLQFIFSMFTQIDEFKEVLTRQNHIDDLVCLLYRVVEMSKHPIAYSVNSLGASAEVFFKL